jgi:hypothetical protein
MFPRGYRLAMGRRLRSTLFALPLLLAPALAGCGDEASAAEIVRSAPEATVEASTARMSFQVGMPSMAGVGDGTMTGEGLMDFERQIGSMTFDLGPLMEASGEQPPPGMATEMEVIFDGTVFYMRFPMLAAAFGPEAEGKEWIKIDLDSAAADMGFDLSQLEQLGNDPRQQLAYLTGVSDDIEDLGEEVVRDTETTHYRGTASMDAAFDQLEEQGLVDVEQFRKTVGELGIDEVPFDVWIDDEGRARRMKMTMPMPPQSGVKDGQIDLTMEMFDFGTDVDIQPPSPDITLDVTDMAAQAAAEGG